jgi:hypothetical protein
VVEDEAAGEERFEEGEEVAGGGQALGHHEGARLGAQQQRGLQLLCFF